MRIINEKLENSKNVLSSQITELKALCSQTTFYQDQYRQINIEMERVLSEIRAVEESRKADKEQIKTLTEKNSYLVIIIIVIFIYLFICNSFFCFVLFCYFYLE